MCTCVWYLSEFWLKIDLCRTVGMEVSVSHIFFVIVLFVFFHLTNEVSFLMLALFLKNTHLIKCKLLVFNFLSLVFCQPIHNVYTCTAAGVLNEWPFYWKNSGSLSQCWHFGVSDPKQMLLNGGSCHTEVVVVFSTHTDARPHTSLTCIRQFSISPYERNVLKIYEYFILWTANVTVEIDDPLLPSTHGGNHLLIVW